MLWSKLKLIKYTTKYNSLCYDLLVIRNIIILVTIKLLSLGNTSEFYKGKMLKLLHNYCNPDNYKKVSDYYEDKHLPLLCYIKKSHINI